MKFNTILIITLFMLPISVMAEESSKQDNDRKAAQHILDRYRELFLSRRPPAAENVRKTASSLTKDGRWPDINYADKTQSTWRPRTHLLRLRTMTMAFLHPDSKLRGDASLRDALLRALDHWLAKRYHQGAWWHDRIGTPRLMRDVLVILGNDLTPERRKRGWQVVAQSKGVDMTGANLIWLADLSLSRAAASGNTKMLAHAAACAAAEIKVSTDEGIQPDYSFHQHNEHLQTFHYGNSYVHDLSAMAWILRGTPWAFSQEKIRILVDYVVEGMDWMRRGKYTVPATLDRASTRVNALGRKQLTTVLKRLRDILPDQAKRMNAIIEREKGQGNPLIGFRHFPRSDFTVYHQNDFSFFLKTMSTRTLPSEEINGENLKGDRMYCSDALIMRNGQEYFNMMPVWDWFWLPGITIAGRLPEFKRCPFVGGAGNGQSGLTAIDYRFGNKLTMRKAYFCHGDRVVCLIGGMCAPDHPHGSATALDQCRLDGPVTIGLESGHRTIEKSQTVSDVSWLHHRGVAYVLLSPGRVNIKMGKVTGSWHLINRALSRETLTDQVFLPILYHRAKPKDASSGYVLAPASTAQAAAAIARKPGFSILANSRDVQAVHFDNGPVMAAFYRAGSLAEKSQPLITVDHPCLLLTQKKDVWVSNPLHKACTISIEIKGRPRVRVSVPGNGQTVQVGHTPAQGDNK